MPVPNDRKYSQTHEWFKLEGNIVTIGLTQFAADELTDVTYVDLPEVGEEIEGGSHFGEIESVKATSEMYTAISGTVQSVNERLADEPELVNADPFGDGWMLKVECNDSSPLDKLMDGPAYEKMISE
ncbi:MAG: glycine cleavage system protein GcvH [Planctomycetota bacterium]